MEHPSKQDIMTLIGHDSPREEEYPIMYKVDGRFYDPFISEELIITAILPYEDWFCVYAGNKLLTRVHKYAVSEVRYV